MPIAGSLWVEGSYLYYIDVSGYKWRTEGYSLGLVSTAIPGSIWISGDYIYYIDASKYKRRCPVTAGVSVNGIAGSVWLDGDRVYFLSESRVKNKMHSDYSDHTHTTPHTDDPPTPYGNYTDLGYWMEWIDSHGDWVDHTDRHSDVHNPIKV